ncbi:TerB family tellurite resistance protein (plasmid) [Streptomyces clavuligerus]|nr:tellurite resistance TerB family protein [Streptomyces clavuligerus]ANW22238.1 tellurium resistance protein [Streptomyces clavuligerus]AXU17134.1 TerB family tellurite resistance protein [Streptomyces clavuligerus]EDY47702.1 tellurium resistance protein [Streptomyces clavuligerus]MBY6307220.1 TerB family tellurite resistance protein [Streptomyces clavuligerus]QCS10202.1 TerB family tellurite resistance protein [Streptomyces clavuligerus]
MAMWDRIKDQAAKALQQQMQGGAGSGHGHSGHGGHGGHTGHAGPGAMGGAPGAPGGAAGKGGPKDQLVGLLKTQLDSLKTELKSGAFRDASMALCALVAAADGHVDPSERQHVESQITSNSVLQNFPADQLRSRFGKHVDLLMTDFARGRTEAFQEVAKVAKKPAEARAVIQTGIVIAGADGWITPAEEQILREACTTLGLSSAEFGI